MIISTTRNKIIITLFLILLFYIIFVIYSGIEQIIETYHQIELLYLIPIFCLLSFTIFVRSQIQRILLNAVGINLTIKQNYILFLTGLSMAITPIGFGQMIKSHFIEQKHGYPISKSLPLVFIERLLDFIAIIVILWICLSFHPSHESFTIVIISTVLIFSLLLIIKNNMIRNKIQSIISKNSFLSKKFSNFQEFNESLIKISDFNILFKTSLFTLLTTLLEGFIIYFGFLAFHVDLGYFESIQLFYTSILLGIFSFLPGGIGVTEGSFVMMMVKQNFEFVLATSLILFLRLITIWSVSLIGFIATYFITQK
jgi:glycosyltransferase 2 family protein